MAKFQVPTVGGIRKVIKQTAVTPGTTIAGLEGQTVTIEQLAALLGVTIPPNTGGGNIGQGDEATLSLGPGLAGGGPLVGNVPVRLTTPMPLIGEDGPPGEDSFVPGPQGQRGPVGPAGPISMYQFDDSSTDEALLPMSAPANFGAATINGNATITAASGAALAVGNNVFSGFNNIKVSNLSTTNNDLAGFEFDCGSSTMFLLVSNQNQSAGLAINGPAIPQSLIINVGAFPIVFATNNTYRGQITSTGPWIIASSIGIRGAVPAVSAGQTDIGNTTTVTVITTAGGIALPALASTFWRVNVNGIAYGVPLFAL